MQLNMQRTAKVSLAERKLNRSETQDPFGQKH
jgi:hypothetical protein